MSTKKGQEINNLREISIDKVGLIVRLKAIKQIKNPS